MSLLHKCVACSLIFVHSTVNYVMKEAKVGACFKQGCQVFGIGEVLLSARFMCHYPPLGILFEKFSSQINIFEAFIDEKPSQ